MTFASLTEIMLDRNKFSAFHDLSNVSSTIRRINPNYNAISNIAPNLLDQLGVREWLELSDNPLSFIPDIPGPSNSLHRLTIGGPSCTANHIPSIPTLGKSITFLATYNTENFVASIEGIGLVPKKTKLFMPYDTNLQVHASLIE